MILEDTAPGYCDECGHPVGYHSGPDDACSMPVVPGTHMPISQLDTRSETCSCGIVRVHARLTIAQATEIKSLLPEYLNRALGLAV